MTEHILERQGAPLHYWIEGPEDRPLTICTHGATVDHHMFAAQLPALTPAYRVLTWDVRGHGRSRPLETRFSIDDCVNDLLNLRLGEVPRQAHLRSIIERSIDRQIAMYDVILRNIADLAAEGCQVAVIVQTIVENPKKQFFVS